MMIHFGLEGLLPLVLYIGMFVAFALSMFWRPSLGIYIMVLTLPLQTGRAKLQQFPLGAEFIDILLLGTVLGLMLKGEQIIPRNHLNRFFFLFAVFCYFSLWEGSFFINAPLPFWISDERFSDWKNYVEMFFFALIVASTIKEKAQVRILVLVMCISVLVVNRSFYSTMSTRDLTHFSYEVRDSGPLGYAGVNGLAAFEAMFASFLLGIYSMVEKRIVKAGILAMLATCGYCLLYAFSRGGYMAFLVGLITVGLFKTRWFLILAVIMVLGWQTLLPVSVQERITMTTGDAAEGQQFDSSAQDRLVLWHDAIELFKRNPITGAGFSTYKFMGRVGGYRDTHNYYIKVLAEMGVAGMLLFLILLGKLFRSGISLFYGTDDPFWRAVALGFTAATASLIVANFFGDRWTYQQLNGYMWVMLGCVIRGLITIREQQEKAEADDALPAYSLKEAELAAV
jgi:putative inorganic carbon (hco3(-)) transporter